MDYSDMDFPDMLMSIMDTTGATQETIAARVGVTQGAVGKWATRTRRPQNLTELAEKLDVPLPELAAAVARTVIVKTPTTAALLRECQQEVDRLREEVRQLRSQPQGGRS